VKYTNKFNLPEPVVRALSHDDYDKGASNRSVTGLIKAPRQSILEKEHDDEIEQDVSDLIWSAHGKAMHKLFEGYGDENWLPEQRLFIDIEGWVVSGQIDIQHVGGDDVVLWDYKECKAWAVMLGKEEWIQQQNCYAKLVRDVKGYNVVGLNVLAIIRDWFWRDAKTKRDYPPAGIIPVPLPLWTPEQATDYMVERVRLHQAAEFDRLTGTQLPFCTPHERWLKPTTYAVKKPKNKRALRVYDTEKEALGHINNSEDKLIMEVRPGEATRCMEYCLAAPFCDQYQAELKATEETTDGDDS
jgi:hypothetical protein